MFKKLVIFLLFYFFWVTEAFAQEGSAIIINQLRGSEICCQAGNSDLINTVKNNQNLKDLHYGWALRYDALLNKEITVELRDLGEFGLLLEVTPELSKESGVLYKGKADGSDWYFAKNAFLVGYTQEERKKIIDTLFTAFKKEFGYYPEFTVSWMIDAWSLSYINNTYKVKLHELTKEQYETDSYTLYGGIFNVPYYPSKNYPLLPGTGEDRLDLIIVRQTVSDILQNYGSGKSYFTSQPNDYLNNPDKLDFSYFQKLIKDTLSKQNLPQFILLGFENSFPLEKYGSEYLKQLEYISELQKQGKLKIKEPSEYALDFKTTYEKNQPFYFQENFTPGADFGVLWYFGKNYRARIIVKKGKVILDDLRNYLDVDDPYKENPATLDYAYWIIPYLIDGSQQYNLSSVQEKQLIKKNLLGDNTISDLYTDPFGIILGEGSFILSQNGSGIDINFPGKNSAKVSFLAEEISIDKNSIFSLNTSEDISLKDLFNNKETKTLQFKKHFDFYLKPNGEILELGWTRDNNFTALFELVSQNNLFILKPVLIKNIDLLKPIFQPDRVNLPVDPKQSVYYWNNKKAIAGRNPLRLFILPLNILGRSTSVKEIKVNLSENEGVKVTYPVDYSYRITPFFIDITADQAKKISLSVTVDGVDVIEDTPVEFITDCKKKISVCLTSAPQIIQYMIVVLNEQKLRLFKTLKIL